jgi:hypothetical protein
MSKLVRGPVCAGLLVFALGFSLAGCGDDGDDDEVCQILAGPLVCSQAAEPVWAEGSAALAWSSTRTVAGEAPVALEARFKGLSTEAIEPAAVIEERAGGDPLTARFYVVPVRLFEILAAMAPGDLWIVQDASGAPMEQGVMQGLESITVPAGTFECYRLSVLETVPPATAGGAATQLERTVWLHPAAWRVREITGPLATPISETVLDSYLH